MRSDWYHVIRECGKSAGPSHKTRRWQPPHRGTWEDDPSPTRVSIRPRKVKTRSQKRSGIRHNVLRRLVESHTGTSWSTFYSDFRQSFRRPTGVSRAAMSSLRFLADIGTNGALKVRPANPKKLHANRSAWCSCLKCKDINPLTGQSMRGKQWQIIDRTRYAEKRDGIWYIHTVGQHDPDDIVGFDHRTMTNVTFGQKPDVPRSYISDTRQANRKILRQLNLRNN